VDTTLSRVLAERDPGQMVLAKAVLGAGATTLLVLVFGEPLPSVGAALALFATGASGYGLSLRFCLLAQRALGVARTGSMFAFAAFIGAAVAQSGADHAVAPASGSQQGQHHAQAQQMGEELYRPHREVVSGKHCQELVGCKGQQHRGIPRQWVISVAGARNPLP
jgi:hypothetical protein